MEERLKKHGENLNRVEGQLPIFLNTPKYFLLVKENFQANSQDDFINKKARICGPERHRNYTSKLFGDDQPFIARDLKYSFYQLTDEWNGENSKGCDAIIITTEDIYSADTKEINNSIFGSEGGCKLIPVKVRDQSRGGGNSQG
jgi:hypothetical protein